MSYVRSLFVGSLVLLASVPLSPLVGCGTSQERSDFGIDPNLPIGVGSSGAFDGGSAGEAPEVTKDPETCAEAEQRRSYVGCDYWPTVTANVVKNVFDYAVVVSNTSKSVATVTVTGPSGFSTSATVAAGSLEKIYLPWVPALKGKEVGTTAEPLAASVVARGGAYHLESSVPVVVTQFNALQYEGGQGGPPGKSWAGCSGGCFSYSNDASLLLPSTAWTGNYRVTGVQGWSNGMPGKPDTMGGYIVVTAAKDGTNVTVFLGSKAKVLAAADGQIAATDPNGTVTLQLNAGDAAEIATPPGKAFDMSGSLVQASGPVQVLTGIPCTNVPQDKNYCDHVEESVVPAEALGKRYVVTTPTRPKGGPGLHVVRFYGNRDGTSLEYLPGRPQGCPGSLAAGEVAECGPLDLDFVVKGSQEFGVSSFQVGSVLYTPETADEPSSMAPGDPAQTSYASTEQFRTTYVFLAPDDYDMSYGVVVGPPDAKVIIDGTPLTDFQPLAENLGVWRADLGAGQKGAHTLYATKPVGLQVMGYGAYTSYGYPGGLDLRLIAPPPPSPR